MTDIRYGWGFDHRYGAQCIDCNASYEFHLDLQPAEIKTLPDEKINRIQVITWYGVMQRCECD